jgi:hypothetical protein
MDLATSTHALLRVGEQEDLYYTDPANCKKQSIPVEYNTRFRQDFSNKSSGTSVFIIPPGNGLRHIIVVIGYNAATINGNTGGAVLPRGWGYNAISQISFRIGGSSQYFLQGDQLLARNLRLCRTQSQRDAILQLGGAECKVAADFATDQYAYIPISVFAGPSADGISLPLPADLLSQQVQITAQLNPSAAFWVTNPNPGATVAVIPTAFDTAFFQVEQLVMNDRAMSLASRVDLDTHSYNMAAVPFDQQTLTIPLSAGGAQQQVTLTGFRSGEVTRVQMWLTKDSDALNPSKWYVPKAVTALYAGVIFAQYEAGSSRLWNLLDGTAPAAVNQSVLTAAGGGGGAMTSAPALSEWCELPFSQPTGRDFEADVLVHGKQILNGLVNLQITPPDASAYTLHVVYVYNSTLTFSRGSCDFVF